MQNFVHQRGTARNGQNGVVTEVYVNAVRFLSDTGAHFTLLTAEFTPAFSDPRDYVRNRQVCGVLFGGIGARDGFHYVRRSAHRDGQAEHVVHRIPAPATHIESPEQHAARFSRALQDISDGVRYH